MPTLCQHMLIRWTKQGGTPPVVCIVRACVGMPQLGRLLVRPSVLNISYILNYFDIQVTAAGAVDREFCVYKSPRTSFWDAMGLPWVPVDAIWLHLAVLAPALVPFGVPWGALGLPLGCLGTLLGSLWLPLGGLGVPCGCFPNCLATGNLVCHEVTHAVTRSAIVEFVMVETGAT